MENSLLTLALVKDKHLINMSGGMGVSVWIEG